MCFFYKPPKEIEVIEQRFNARISHKTPIDFTNPLPDIYNGFAHPQLPVITAQSPEKIQFYEWGLLPSWAKDKKFQASTLNARFESLHEKPSFRNILNNRCIIPAEAFVEWQWVDPKGKEKIKYLLKIDKNPIFAFAGLWSEWSEPTTGKLFPTFTIITTEANELMARIHNTKKRMPIILLPESEQDWLKHGSINMWNDKLTATAK